MYLLDANVVSEMMKVQTLQDRAFYTWTQQQPLSDLFISSFTLSEIYAGIYTLAQGKKRAALYGAIKRIEQLFDAAIVPFDKASAEQFGVVRERTKRSGLSMDMADSYYLAAAERNAAVVVTRNVKHFLGRTELELLNPWQALT